MITDGRAYSFGTSHERLGHLRSRVHRVPLIDVISARVSHGPQRPPWTRVGSIGPDAMLTRSLYSLPTRVRERCPPVPPQDTGPCPAVHRRQCEHAENPGSEAGARATREVQGRTQMQRAWAA